jgi:hypothetical protein
MQASQPLASGAADAVSTGSSYGRGYFPPVTRATVTSDMVASSETDGGAWIYDQRLPINDIQLNNWQGYPMAAAPINKAAIVASLPAPKKLFAPRSGVGHALWNNDIINRLATCRLLDTSSQPPPIFEDMAYTFPHKSGREQYSLLMAAVDQYREENTLIYNLVMGTIDLSGNREETDIDYLARHFHHGIHRDGQGLIGWITKLNNHSDVGEQDRLQTELADAKLKTPPAQVTIPILEKHCTDLLSLWLKINGNHISSPASFNSRLLSSIPQQGSSGTALGSLRSWFADKITDRAHFLAEPDGLIDAILAHARTLGVPTAGGASDRGQVFTMFNNNCKICSARVCSAGDKKANCICFNPSKPLPADASDGERSFVFICREYVKEFEPTTLKGLSKLDMQAKITEKKEVAKRVASKPTHSATPIISNQKDFDTWFQSMMGAGAGNLKVVNPVIAPIYDEGGLCKGQGGQLAMDDCADVFTKPLVNMITPRSEIASPLDAARAVRSHLRSPLSLGIESGLPAARLFSAAPPSGAPAVAAPLSRVAPPRLARLRSSFLAALGALLAKIRGSSSDERKHASLVVLLGVIVARHFSSPAAALLASRWARLRAALLLFALRLVRMLGVGASRVSMAASIAEPQLAAAVVG